MKDAQRGGSGVVMIFDEFRRRSGWWRFDFQGKDLGFVSLDFAIRPCDLRVSSADKDMNRAVKQGQGFFANENEMWWLEGQVDGGQSWPEVKQASFREGLVEFLQAAVQGEKQGIAVGGSITFDLKGGKGLLFDF